MTTENEILRFAASLEKSSEHPLAEAIIKGAEEQNVELAKVENFESITGKGIVGTIDGERDSARQRQIDDGQRH